MHRDIPDLLLPGNFFKPTFSLRFLCLSHEFYYSDTSAFPAYENHWDKEQRTIERGRMKSHEAEEKIIFLSCRVKQQKVLNI